MTEENINWRNNISIGSRIIIDDKAEVYIFYGYNYDKTIASCFPTNSACMIEKMIYVPIKAILSIHSNQENQSNNSTELEDDIQNKLHL